MEMAALRCAIMCKIGHVTARVNDAICPLTGPAKAKKGPAFRSILPAGPGQSNRALGLARSDQ
jgi:hypothetical protein